MKTGTRVLLTTISVGIAVGAFIFLNRLRRLGDMDSAIGDVRMLGTAETKFAEAHPGIGYACDLSSLDNNGLPPELIKKRERNNFAFSIDCGNPVGTHNSHYEITARPLIGDMPAFCINESGVIRYDNDGLPDKCLRSGTPF